MTEYMQHISAWVGIPGAWEWIVILTVLALFVATPVVVLTCLVIYFATKKKGDKND